MKSYLSGFMAASFLLAGATPAAPSPPPEREAHRSPDYCAYTAHNLAQFVDLERRQGFPLRCAVIFSDVTTSWADWEKPWFLRARDSEVNLRWRVWVTSRPERRLIITHSLVPQTAPADWRARGAAGEYDAHARALSRALVRAGLGDSVIRLAHEPNGTWYTHSVGDSTAQRREWARYWARTVRAMRSVSGARFQFDLTVNAAVRPIPLAEYYPGDDVVDVIGIDQYDSCTGRCAATTGARRWRLVRDQPGGFATIAAFARAHRKPISVPETGLVARDRHGAGDDPAFLRGLRSELAQHDVAYVGYFDKNVNGVLRLEEVPRSFQVWRAMARPQDSVRR